jgi:hypothetical protein
MLASAHAPLNNEIKYLGYLRAGERANEATPGSSENALRKMRLVNAAAAATWHAKSHAPNISCVNQFANIGLPLDISPPQQQQIELQTN